MPTGLTLGNLSRVTSLNTMMAREAAQGGEQLESQSSHKPSPNLDLTSKCQIGAASSARLGCPPHLVRMPLSADYPPTGRVFMICIGARHRGLANTPQRSIILGLRDLGCAPRGVFLSEPP